MGTILMVAVTVVLAAVLYVIVGPMINPEEEPPLNLIILDQGGVLKTDATHWDTYFTIAAVESNERFKWDDVSMVILADHGSLLTDATMSYGDVDGDGVLEPGDSVIVTGMTDEYTGGTLEVLHRGSMIGKSPIQFVPS
jgi:FlaG/FlaF family flagellin (archaellin)